MRRAYRYRAYVNQATDERLRRWQDCLMEVWNRTRALCLATYEMSLEWIDVPVTGYQDPRAYSLIAKRTGNNPQYADVPSSALQYMQIRYFLAMQAFWRRCREGAEAGKKGFPKAKEKEWQVGIVLKANAVKQRGNVLTVAGMALRLRMHRPMQGTPKTVTILREGPHWFVSVSCDGIEFSPLGTSGREVTLEFGSGFFVRDSLGRCVHFPRFYETGIERLRRKSRAMSRKQKGSRRWYDCRRSLAQWHSWIRRKRSHWLWNLAHDYMSRHDTVRVPKWPLAFAIEHASESKKAMRLCDASYGEFLRMLHCKAEEYGRTVVEYTQENAIELAHAL